MVFKVFSIQVAASCKGLAPALLSVNKLLSYLFFFSAVFVLHSIPNSDDISTKHWIGYEKKEIMRIGLKPLLEMGRYWKLNNFGVRTVAGLLFQVSSHQTCMDSASSNS